MPFYGLFQDTGCTPIALVFRPQWTFVLTTLEPDSRYRFRVEAIDRDGRWTRTGPVTDVLTECDSYWDDGCPPTWPAESKLDFVSDGSGAAIVAWTPAVDNRGVGSYRLMRDGVLVDPRGGVSITEFTTDGNLTSHRVAGLEPGSTSEFSVYARDDFGQPVNWVPGPVASYAVPLTP